MTDISKIFDKENNTYSNLADAQARADIEDLKSQLTNTGLDEISQSFTFSASQSTNAPNMLEGLAIPYGTDIIFMIETVSGEPLISGKSVQLRANNKYINAYNDNGLNKWQTVTLTGQLTSGEEINTLGIYSNSGNFSADTTLRLHLISWIKKEISDIAISQDTDNKYVLGAGNLLDLASWTEGYYITDGGVVTANNLFRYSSLIPVDSAEYYKIVVESRKQYESTNTRILAYDSNGEFIKSLGAFRNNNLTDTLTFKVATTNSTAYVRISCKKEPVIKPLYFGKTETLADSINTIEKAIGMTNHIEWQSGRWSATNGGYESASTRMCTVDYIHEDVNSIAVVGNSNITMYVAAWDSNGVFAGVWTGTRIEKTTTYTAQTFIDIAYIRSLYKGYRFKINGRNVANTDVALSDAECIYLFTTRVLAESTDTHIDYDSIVHSVNRIADGLPVPHQSIEGYKYAYKMGFKRLLCDLRFTSDGVPICTHDDYMNQYYADVYDSNGILVPNTNPIYFSSLTYAELSEYDFGLYRGEVFRGTKILTLEEMLNLCKCIGAIAYIEMKVLPTQAQFDTVFNLIHNYGMSEKTVWCPTTAEMLNAVTAYNENVYLMFQAPTSGVYTEMPDTFVDLIISKVNAYNRGNVTITLPSTVNIADSQLKRLSLAGVGICTGTASNSEYIDNYMAKGTKYNSFVESPSMTFVVGQYLYEKYMK